MRRGPVSSLKNIGILGFEVSSLISVRGGGRGRTSEEDGLLYVISKGGAVLVLQNVFSIYV